MCSDGAALTYDGIRFGDLLANFSPKHANAPEPGRLIVGGLDYLTPVGILRGASGPLAEITFKKTETGGSGLIELARSEDDLTGWGTTAVTAVVKSPDDGSGGSGGGGGGGGGCFIGGAMGGR